MKNKKRIIGMVVSIILATLCIVLANTGNPFSKYEQHIKLGYKYLEDENYEEAILAFNKAIEIDAKKTKSYVGLAKTYITRLHENAIEDASNILKDGYEQTKSEDIVNSFLENADKLLNDGKVDEALDLLDKGYEITKDDKMNEKRDEIMEKISGNLLKEIFDLYENNEIDKIKEIMKTEEYKNISNNTSNEKPLIYTKDDTGKGIGIYGPYIYLGGYINEEREGNGIWINVSDEENSIYTGEWKNDIPNGEGELIDTLSNGRVRKRTGGVVNGLLNGEYRFSFDSDEPYIVNYNNGIVKVLEIATNNKSVIGKRNDGTTLVTDKPEKIYGIFGFID